MKTLKCIIVDDEEGAHLVITHYIQKIKTLSLLGSFYNATEAIDFIYNNKIDILFLDINMPGLSGLDMLDVISNRPYIIITTAYGEYALEGYKYEVIDYLVKPFDFKLFLSAIDKVINRINSQVIEQNPTVNIAKHIILKIDGDYVKFDFSEILYIQSYGNYIKVYTFEKMFLSQITTTEIEEKLDKKLFKRIHKSYIVSLKQITKISGGKVYMNNNIILPIGNTFKRELLDLFK